MKVAVVGVTGMVGQVMCKVLEERNFPITEFLPVASERSVGQEITFKGKQHKVISIKDAIEQAPNLAIFSAGGSIAKQFAPLFAAVGTTVVDNSSAFRMDEDKPLIVPEVNLHCLKESDKIIANPNCSTIQLVVALKPLHDAYGVDRLVISTYQSMTGTGVQAVQQYKEEMETGHATNPAYPHPIFQNCLPHCDVFFDNGYTREELKLVHETRKILENNNLRITATAVRVPVQGGHSESVNVSFLKDFEITELKTILEDTEGIIVLDDPTNNTYPMPLNAHHKDDVFVGRIRRDESNEKTLNMWVVADNLRKGAATNAIQIAEYLLQKGWLTNEIKTALVD
ncbi:aspartate-semialdehyde dehydrogenase [Aureispira anguillae]|uniref:Aspartate-semialdehyde dehydrogenase n=1 Tax=Aureispira anguillae TaxID=2864201 RepID=A0A915YK61_9BACT|nr:aspartate-semialdehyde dehydrogenase [Aureispira anguillae]BDS14732.1 aspartate-semialdehyde dehydrogenase [Aureispira anguillae]